MKDTDIEKLFLEPKRLAILCELIKTPEPIEFTALRAALALTDGNLNSHLKRLTEAKIVKIKKKFVKNKPCTLISLSSYGRSVFFEYIKQLETVVKGAVRQIDALHAEEQRSRGVRGSPVPEKS